MWIKNAKYGIKMTGRETEFKFKQNIYQLQYWIVASQTIQESISRSGLSSNQESKDD
jgi:hypothetical protein